jgi:hypothetical protein
MTMRMSKKCEMVEVGFRSTTVSRCLPERKRQEGATRRNNSAIDAKECREKAVAEYSQRVAK